MDDIKIEHNRPLPVQLGRALKYPFDKMKVGDHFTLPSGHHGAGKTKTGISPRVVPAASYYGKRNKKQFSSQIGRDGSVTIWRRK